MPALISTAWAQTDVQPYSSIELKTLADMYQMMQPDELERQKAVITQRQLDLNLELNAPENQSAAKLKELRIRIERSHAELDLIGKALESVNGPTDFFERYKLLIGIILGLAGTLLILWLVTNVAKRRAQKEEEFVAKVGGEQTSTGNDWREMLNQQQAAPAQNSEAISISGNTENNQIDYQRGGAIPIHDIQSHVDHLLLNNPNGYTHLLEFLFFQAIAWHASDIHMQRAKGWFSLQFRIDGELHDICVLDLYREKEVINVIKVQAKLKFDRSTTALDGRISYVLYDKHYDFRVSVIPTMETEKVVIRIFDEDQTPYELHRLGLSQSSTELMDAALKNRHGLLLVVGPAGSGKTTTIYSSLLYMRKTFNGLNIISLEDPVEHRIEGITQIHIDPNHGMDYESAFTNILRQDPEVVMIGEIRTPAVGSLSVRAGYTGHLVISTVHSASTIGAVDRMLEFGIEPYNLHTSLIGVISQRLVKKVCPYCAQPYSPDPDLLAKAMPQLSNVKPQWQKGRGCDNCMNTGYRDRIVIDEMIAFDPDSRHELSVNSDAANRRDVLKKLRNHTLWEDGITKAALGLTTLEEVAHILGDMAHGGR